MILVMGIPVTASLVAFPPLATFSKFAEGCDVGIPISLPPVCCNGPGFAPEALGYGDRIDFAAATPKISEEARTVGLHSCLRLAGLTGRAVELVSLGWGWGWF